MDIYEDIDPVELTGYARARLEDRVENEFIFEAWYPNANVNDLDYRVKKNATTNFTRSAEFRGFDTEAPVIGGDGFSTLSGELPPVSIKSRVDEYTRLRAAGLDDAIRDEVENRADKMVRAIRIRMERARVELSRTGKMVIDENGVKGTIDFERAAGHDVTPAGDPWTTSATCDPILDLLTWVEAYSDTNGFLPGGMVMNLTTRRYMLTAAAVRSLAPKGLIAPTRLAPSALAEVLADQELPPALVYDAKVNVGGTVSKLIPDGEVIFMPPADTGGEKLGESLFGLTAEALELNIDRTEAPGIVVSSWKYKDPVALWTHAAAVGVPVSGNPDQTMRATVS